jgi:hypothetical protein
VAGRHHIRRTGLAGCGRCWAGRRKLAEYQAELVPAGSYPGRAGNRVQAVGAVAVLVRRGRLRRFDPAPRAPRSPSASTISPSELRNPTAWPWRFSPAEALSHKGYGPPSPCSRVVGYVYSRERAAATIGARSAGPRAFDSSTTRSRTNAAAKLQTSAAKGQAPALAVVTTVPPDCGGVGSSRTTRSPSPQPIAHKASKVA